MKTFIGVMLLALWPYLTFGQSLHRPAFQKGSVLLGGELAMGWGSSNVNIDYGDQFTTIAFTLAPKAALFLTNGVALGIATDYTANKFTEYGFNVSTTDLSIGPLIRIYAFDGFFIQSAFTFGKMTKGFDEPAIKKFTFGVGYAFPVSKVVFIEPVIQYRNSKCKIENEYIAEQTELKLNEFVAAVGIGIYLQKKP